MARTVRRRRTRSGCSGTTRVTRRGALDPRKLARVRTMLVCTNINLTGRLLATLSGNRRVEIVGVVSKNEDARRLITEVHPDVVVLYQGLNVRVELALPEPMQRRSVAVPGVVVLLPESEDARIAEILSNLDPGRSYLLIGTALRPGELSYAAQCTAWSVPVVDPKLYGFTSQGRENVRPRRNDADTRPVLVGEWGSWHGKTQRVSVVKDNGCLFDTR